MYTRYAQLRDERGFTDNAVATKTGIPQSTIYDWKQRSANNADASLSADKLLLIARLFEVPLETFLEG